MGRERRTGRRRRGDVAQAEVATQLAAQPVHNLPVYEILDEEGLETIHRASMQILSEIGIDFYDDESLSILKEHGADVEGETARFDEALVLEYVAKAPATFTQLARNRNATVVGGNHLTFAPVYGRLCHGYGARPAQRHAQDSELRPPLYSALPQHSGGTIVEPTDLPVETRHLDMVYSHIRFSDKPFMGSVMSAENAADSVAMAEIVFGAQAIREQPALISLINISSPRRLDDRMLGALKTYARARQATVTPLSSGPFVTVPAPWLAVPALAGIVCQMCDRRARRLRLLRMDLQAARVFGSPKAEALFVAQPGATTCPSAAAACSPPPRSPTPRPPMSRYR